MKTSSTEMSQDWLLELLRAHIEALQLIQTSLPFYFLAIDEEISRMWELYRRVVNAFPLTDPNVKNLAPLTPASSFGTVFSTMQMEIDIKRPDLLSELVQRLVAESSLRYSGITGPALQIKEDRK